MDMSSMSGMAMSTMASSMDMASSMTMAMSSTGTAAAASATSTMDMSSMDMGGDCQVSMLWNWYTIDACFLTTSWHITSRGMFAGSCIGVILMVMLLEFLRRAAKEYDRLLLRQHQRAVFAEASSSGSSTPQRTPAPTSAPELAPSSCCDNTDSIESEKNEPSKPAAAVTTAARTAAFPPSRRTTRFRPNVMQQAIRAFLHLLQFALAYFVMLLAMYYNGYLIICIFIGAFLGAFIFSWESVEVAVGGATGMGVEEDPTVCCG
ncbi:ctr copper transporter family protein [Diplodia corticola]|uniref:Copper transport protein n=1 Tax=Diplodia corticola TaxID=236234 RepID=A0A1J9QY26_9PEZI|nr:ctr copper transporter family protein [Diplodia corticola]OJD33288.1 ctr copper transporter family protein [Diplodia corticola]